ncbi:MAG: L-threonylcarbamoyladenylate synthase [Muribaculaceae bacterium]
MEDDLKQCLEVLKRGGLILYPTDTIWGIGCDATNEDAVKRIYELKRRSDNKAMLVLIDAMDHIDHYVVDVPEMAYELMDVAVEPLTIIYDGAFNLARNLLGNDDSVGIRVSHEKFSQTLCARFHKPIVSTSANISGTPSPKTFADIDEAIKQGVDYVVNYRRDDKNPQKSSNIIKLSCDGTFKIIR